MDSPEESFRRIYNENRSDLFGYILKLVQDENVALDVLQDSFLNFIQVFRTRPLPPDLNCRMYLFRIARNLVINRSRTAFQRRVDVRDTIDRETDHKGTPEEEILEKLDQEGLERELESYLQLLPEQQRSAILLRYFYDMKLEDIAETLDTSVSTAYREIKRGLETLKEDMESSGFRPG